MKIPFDPEKYGDASPGDTVDIVGQAVVSEDGNMLEVVSIEDVPMEDSEETPEEEVEEAEEEEMAAGDLDAIIAQGVGGV